MIEAICFDLDGVLIDATEWHYQALNDALALFGYSISYEEHLSEYNGLPTRVKLEKLSSKCGLPRSLHDFVNEMKQAFTRKHIASNCRPSYDKIMMLRKLRADGYKLCVCSNAVRETVLSMLARAQIQDFFHVVLSNSDVVSPKPDPEIYLKAFSELRIPPGRGLIVEDNVNGIQAATLSGANVMAVTGYGDVCYSIIKQRLEKEMGQQR